VTVWPRLSRPIADREWQRIRDGAPPLGRTLLREATFRSVGERASGELEALRKRLHQLAGGYGFPGEKRQEAQAVFDRTAAFALREEMPIAYAEAASDEVWSYVALGILPELTAWRFGTKNRERFIGIDLTRHTWGRLWWQAEAFGDEPELLQTLTEGDLNQLFERRAIGGDGRLVRALTRAFTAVQDERRLVVRDVTLRLRRLLAFVETTALTAAELRELAEDLVILSAAQVTGERVVFGVDAGREDEAEEDLRGATAEVPDVREAALGQREATYRRFERPAALSAPQLLSVGALRSMLKAAVQIEGPVTRRRLGRIVAGASEQAKISRGAEYAINGAIDYLFDAGQLVIDNPFNSGRAEDQTVRLKGTDPTRIRPRGDRELEDIPPSELIAVAALVPGRARVDRIAYLREFYDIAELTDYSRRLLLRAVMAAEETATEES
jgi:hypothetical protein